MTKRRMRKKVRVAASDDFVCLITVSSEVQEKEGIDDHTSTNLVNLRRVIYLTIMNALNYEEAVHKLLKVQIEEGEEVRYIQVFPKTTLTNIF